jgi:protein gp37
MPRQFTLPDLGEGLEEAEIVAWLGVTAENQQYFDQRWRILQRIPSVVRFISYEPALGSLVLPNRGPLPDWLISGGESGPGARPLKPRWIRTIIADCRSKDIAVFHKQWGNYQNNPLVVEENMSIKDAASVDDFGKGGGLVGGKLVREFPSRSRLADRKAT